MSEDAGIPSGRANGGGGSSGPVSVRDAGAVAIGGDVSLTGGIVAGRDLTIAHLTLISDDGPPAGDAIGRPGQDNDVCPYPGIAAFADQHTAFFFGRDRDVTAIVGLLARANLVAVIGSSGSGKSSLLAAGVIPSLRRGALPGSDQWSIELLRPGIKPLDQLAARLSARPGGINLNEATEALRNDATTFARLAQEMSDAVGAPVLWVVDQFEEVFDDEVDPAERTEFFSALVAAAATGGGSLRVLLAMRSDFYPNLDIHRYLADAVAAHQHRLLPLDKSAIREVIVRPAEEVGLRVEPALVDEILKEVEPSANLLPLLAYALQQTWRRRRNGWLTVAGYIESGGVSGALEQGAEQVWGALSIAERDAGRRILLRLAHTSDTGAPTRRRARGRDLVTDVDLEPTVVAVVTRFAAARLLTIDVDDTGEPTVEVTHEALLREWPLLRSWLLGDREARRVQQDLADAVASWTGRDHDTAYLFQGGRLNAVEAVRARGELALNEDERRFISASRKLDAAQKRRSRLLVALPLGLAVAVAFAAVVVVQQRQTAHQKVVAEALQVSAEARAVVPDQRDLGVLLSLAALNIDDNPTTRATLLDTESSPDGPIAFAIVAGSRANVIATTFAPDGSVVAGAADGTVRLISPTDGRETAPPLTGHRDALTAVAVSPSGLIASGATDGRVLIHQLGTTTQPSAELSGATSPIRAIVVDRTGSTVAAASSDGRILRWRTPFSEPPLAIAQVATPIASLALAETSRQLATVTGSGELRRWRIDTGEPLASPDPAASVRGGPNVRLVASAAGDLVAVDGDKVTHWDLAHEPVSPASGDLAGASAVALAPDGNLAVVGTANGGVTSWVTTPRPTPISTPRGGLSLSVNGLATDGTYVVGLDAGGRMISWNLAGKRSPMGVPTATQAGDAIAVAFAPDGTLARAGRSGRIILSGAGRATPTVVSVGNTLTGLAWQDNATLVVSGEDGSVRQLDAHTGNQRLRAPPSAFPVIGLATAAGNTVGWVDATGDVVIESPSGRRQLNVPGRPVTAFALSPDGSSVAVGSGDATRSTVTMLSLTDKRPTVRVLRGHTLKVTGLKFSPDGKTLASGSDDWTIQLWSVPSGRKVGQLIGHTDMVIALAFSPDGKFLASGGEDETLAVWDFQRRKQIGRMNYGGTVWSLAISPDAHFLAGGHGALFVAWPFGMPSWKARACAFAHRDLTAQEWTRYAPGRPRHPLCAHN